MIAKDFDIFVSYKSENADQVRAVVECLIASGVRVWFAEYYVLLANYDQFQQAINEGICSSSYALLFTNDLWADSKYCKLEYKRIRGHMESSHILEVCIPQESKTYEYYPELRNGPSVTWYGEVREIVAFVRQHAGEINLSTPILPNIPAVFKHKKATLRFGINLNIGPLYEKAPPPEIRLKRPLKGWLGGEVYYFAGHIEDYHVDLMIHISPFVRSAISNELSDALSDDREIYKAYRCYAEKWLGDYNYDARGLHLLSWQGHRQMALTYSEPTPRGWHRRYVLLFVNPNKTEVGEVNLDVVISSPVWIQDQLAFSKFCQFTPLLDFIASSVEYDQRRMDSEEMVFLTWTTIWLFLVAFVVYDYLVAQGSSLFLRSTAIGVVGAITGQYLFLLSNKESRRGPLRVGTAIGPRTRFWPGSYVRQFDRFWDLLVGLIVWTFILIFKGIAAFIAFILAGVILGIREPWYWGLVGALGCASGIRMSKGYFDIREGDITIRIEQHEGRKERVYIDTEGHAAIGVGYDLDQSDAHQIIARLGLSYKEVRDGRTELTDEQINVLRDMDISRAIRDASELFPSFYCLSFRQQMALADMAFDLGKERLAKFEKLKDAVARKDWNAAAYEIRNSEWAVQVGVRADHDIADIQAL